MSFSELSAALTRAVNRPQEMATLVEWWPGLALLAHPDGRVVAASQRWSEIGITPSELRALGWRYFVLPDDAAVTDAEVVDMTGADGRPAVGFQNRYRSRDGRVTALRWTATPFVGDERMTLALAEVVDG